MLTGKGLALVDEAAPPVWLGIGDCIVVASDGLQSLAEEEIRRSPARRSRTHAAATPPRRCRHRAVVVQRSIPQVAGRHWCRPQARRRQFHVPCRTRHRVALQRALPGGMGARTQAARLGLSISRECHRGGLKSACRCLFVQPFVRVVLGEAGSFVRFEVFEH